MSTGWHEIHPNELDQEIKHSMIRNEVENAFCLFKFLYKINDEYGKKFTQYDYYDKNVYDVRYQRKNIELFIEGMKNHQENV